MESGDADSKAEAVSALRRLIAACDAAFVIYDLEVTTWEGAMSRRWGGPGEFPEIVQIGAVKLATGLGHAELEFFSSLIRPTRNAVLSDYFVNLTGITQHDVETRGVAFSESLRAFTRFAAGCRAFSNGIDNEWILANCALHGLDNPFQPDALVNFGPVIRQAVGWSGQVFSNELPALLGQANPGPAHEGLSDARAIAMAVRHLVGVVSKTTGATLRS